MEPRDLADYGGPKIDAFPVSDPETQVSSTEHNRLLEDVAQGTRTLTRVIARFLTTNTASPVTYAAAAVDVQTIWGDSDTQKPTVTKTATGRYMITFPASFADALGHVESVSFFSARAGGMSSDPADKVDVRVLTRSANVITVGVYSNGSLADLGASSAAVFLVELWAA